MYLENTKSTTLSADTVINPLTWMTVTGTATSGYKKITATSGYKTITATPGYTVTTSTATVPIDIEALKNDLKNTPLTMFSETIKAKKEKIDPRLKKINKEIKELREKTMFYSIKEYASNKVYGFRFKTHPEHEYKTICAEEDTFDLQFAFFLAYAKYLNTNLTTEGYMDTARTLSYNKSVLKKVKNGIKLFYKLQERDALEEQIKAEKKHRHDKLVQKKIEKRKRKEDEQIKIIKTAIKASKYEL